MSGFLASRPTREAREDARRAKDAEREHRRDCIACIRATIHRRPSGRCPEGARLYAAARDAAARLRKERELDKVPHPDQMVIFP